MTSADIVKLYHFVHCPYCIRVRLVLGYLKIQYESHVVRYDDVKCRLDLSGQTKLPFVIWPDFSVQPESLEIIERADSLDVLGVRKLKSSADFINFEKFIDFLGSHIHPLCWPYWVYTPEFDEKSRIYTIEKKQKFPGWFNEMFKRRFELMKELSPYLKKIETELRPFYESSTLGLKDVMLAAHLWGLYTVPEFQFSEKIHSYLQNIKSHCDFDYQADFW